MVDGIAEFTREFSGEVWLEVFLLGGVTAIPAEVEKIAALVRKIAPARTQLNTVTRPPAEEFAFVVPREELERLAELIPGTVEIISEWEEGRAQAASVGKAMDEDILALLGRRPCTVEDIAGGLGLNRLEVMKFIDGLAKSGAVVSERVGKKIYYSRAKGSGGR